MLSKILGITTRVATLTAMSGTAVALLVACANPALPSQRVESRPPGLVLSEAITPRIGGGPRLVHIETGQLREIMLPRGVSLALASVSPWQDRGRRQVVGVGWHRTVPGQSELTSSIGIVRMAAETGTRLVRAETGTRLDQ